MSEEALSGGAAASSRPPWSAFRAALAEAGFRPSRRLGQNFLIDENMCRALVRDAEVGVGDFVLEVGAGCGFLTAHLAAAGAEVLGVEIDPRLLAIARRLLGGRPGVELIELDALAGKHRLAPELLARLPAQGPFALVANLPYSIGGPLLAVLSEQANPPRSMHVLVQKEMAERIAAPAGSPARGPLAVKLQACYEVRLGREVPPGLFWPRPKVQSAAVRLELRPDAPAPGPRAALDVLARGLFQRQRQGVGRVLGALLGDPARARELLAGLRIEPLRRPGELSGAELIAIARSPDWIARTDE